MSRRVLAAVAAAAGLVLVAGCAQQYDVEDVPFEVPDEITIYGNVDQHPNITRVCIEGIAFATTTRDYNAVTRVPEWDAHCAEVAR